MTTDSKCYHMTIHLQYFLEKNVPPVADTENNWNISGKRTSCWTTYARYRIWIVWTLVGKSIPSISTTSFTAKYAGVQMGWHCFKIVSSYQRTPSVDSGCPPLPSGPSNNSRTSSVHHGSAKMEKNDIKTAHCKFWIFLMKVTYTGNTISTRDQQTGPSAPSTDSWTFLLSDMSIRSSPIIVPVSAKIHFFVFI